MDILLQPCCLFKYVQLPWTRLDPLQPGKIDDNQRRLVKRKVWGGCRCHLPVSKAGTSKRHLQPRKAILEDICKCAVGRDIHQPRLTKKSLSKQCLDYIRYPVCSYHTCITSSIILIVSCSLTTSSSCLHHFTDSSKWQRT
jgi:hypothetical protein